jgi:4-hydroxybenzoate polyprenyltransferase
MLALGVVLGYMKFPGSFNFTPPFNHLVYISIIASASLTWMAAVNVNDIYDKVGDRLTNKRRPLPARTLTPSEFHNVTLMYFIGSAFFGLLVSYQFFTLMMAYQAVAALYSMPPIRLKRYPVISKLCIGLASVLMLAAGYVAVNPNGDLTGIPTQEVLFIFFGFALASHVIELKDCESDRQMGVMSLPVLLGVKSAKTVVAIFIAVTFLASPIAFNSTILWPPAILWALLSVIILTRMEFQEKYVFIAYLTYIIFVLIALLTTR